MGQSRRHAFRRYNPAHERNQQLEQQCHVSALRAAIRFRLLSEMNSELKPLHFRPALEMQQTTVDKHRFSRSNDPGEFCAIVLHHLAAELHLVTRKTVVMELADQPLVEAN